MSELHIPGQPSPSSNPLTALTGALNRANMFLETIAKNSTVSRAHIYALSELVDDGKWGVYCLGCSDEQEEYIYPCAKFTERPKPPNTIAVLPEL
jgi:hypothetical protein